MKSMLGVAPILELIQPSFNQSFTFRKFEEPEPNLKPFWHFHPEIELVYIKTGSAKRHIGNHISEYINGDLVLLGPNLPHYGFTERLIGHRSEIVIQMKPEFLGNTFFEIPEMKEIQNLFIKASSGIVFTGHTKDFIGHQLDALAEKESFEKLIGLLKVFRALAISEEYELLNTSRPSLVFKKQDNDKIERVYDYVRTHFTETISLEDISDVVSMEVPSFCRYFKRVTGKTFTEFVNDFRVTHACKLLSESDLPVSAICFESGFNNSSHFNRLFKATTGKTPLEYREEVEHLII
ncbi:MAG: AraC family transcriptional regulator [Saprospiraceae bacterium]